MATWPLPLQYSNATTYAGHAARDIPCPTGTPVFAPVAGHVTWGDQGGGGGGKMVWITPPSNDFSIGLMHLQTQLHQNEDVAEGTQVGISDNTGHSTGPHLHIQYNTGPAGSGSANEQKVVELLAQASGKATGQTTSDAAGAIGSATNTGASAAISPEIEKAVRARNQKGDSFFYGGVGHEYPSIDVPGPKENKPFLNAQYAWNIPMIGTLRKGWIEGGAIKAKLRFQYNPAEVQMEYLFNDSSLTSQELSPFERGLPNVMEGATFSVNLMFDRSAEVNVARKNLSLGQEIIGLATGNNPIIPGVLEDIYILDRLIGVADSGVPFSQPVRVVLSPTLFFQGWLTGASVQYVKFDHHMNPMVATVNVAIRAIFSAPHTTAAGDITGKLSGDVNVPSGADGVPAQAAKIIKEAEAAVKAGQPPPTVPQTAPTPISGGKGH